MEHRCGERLSVNLNILIHRYGMPVAQGRIKNASSHGLFIESDLAEVYPLQQYTIEIMAAPGSTHGQRKKFDSIVIHRNARGFGVELESLSMQDRAHLTELFAHQNIAKRPQENLAVAAFA